MDTISTIKLLRSKGWQWNAIGAYVGISGSWACSIAQGLTKKSNRHSIKIAKEIIINHNITMSEDTNVDVPVEAPVEETVVAPEVPVAPEATPE